MIPISLGDVEALAPGKLFQSDRSERVTGLSIDSRRIQPGDLFVAVGRGAQYVEHALAAGAAAALVPEDAFAALGALARAVRDRTSARVVGITGSTAKTSTKDILGALCRPHACTVVTEASYNNEIGLPLTVARIEEDTDIAILEMAMRGLGQIADLCVVARPEIAVITKVGPVHLELLGTVGRVAQAKAELIAALPPGGTAVVPSREPLLAPYLERDDVRVTRFGPGGQVELLSFTRLPSGSRLEVAVFGDRLELETSLTARYNGINVLAALAAYHALGLPLEKAHVGAAQIKLSRPGRGEEILLPGDGLLINDAYNGNPLSMTAALDHLAERAASRRRVAVLGDMIELGPGASIYHRRVGAYAARREVAALLAVGPLARGYVEGARGVPLTRWIPTVDACLVAVRSVLMPGDCILVKGSRAMGLGAIVDALRSPPA